MEKCDVFIECDKPIITDELALELMPFTFEICNIEDMPDLTNVYQCEYKPLLSTDLYIYIYL